jgi:hypothetical protein
MDKQPFIDRGLLIPIAISVFSIFGIGIALLIVYLDKPQAEISAGPTVTPFKYLLLATETGVPDPELETAPPEEIFTEEPEPESFVFPTVVPPQINTRVNNPLPGPIASSTTAVTATVAVLSVIDRYDDADPRLEYDGDWVNETNVGNAYQGTLSVSNTIDNDLIFTFVGQQIIIGYLGKPGLGSLTLSIDDNDFQLDQSAGKEWVSPQLDNTEHFVIIIHESGASVNLDYINILASN